MKILGILQNQWFHDPERVKSAIEYARQNHGDAGAERYRRRIIHYALFNGCHTGLQLKRAFGVTLCECITWDEASREIGGKSDSVFPADIDHLSKLIIAEQPGVVLAFGNIAVRGVATAMEHIGVNRRPVISGPHPAARDPGTLARLYAMREKLKEDHGV